jgi:hypothetical protein
VGVVKRRVLRGLWRRLVGVAIIGPRLLGAPTLRFAPVLCCRVQGQPALSFVDNGGRHPRVPRSPPSSYRSPSKLLSNHNSLYKNHSLAVCARAHLGTIIWLLLSRMPSEIPLPRAARLFYWYRAGPMPQGVSYVQGSGLGSYIINLDKKGVEY